MAGPGIPQGRCKKNIGLIDLAATLCDLGGADTAEMDGRSFNCLLHGEGDRWDNWALVEYCATWTDRPMAAWRRDHFKLLASLNEPYQMFDLQADPRERCDLSETSEYAEVKKKLVRELQAIWSGEQINQQVLTSQKNRLRRTT
jgi:choline-sulfatase